VEKSNKADKIISGDIFHKNCISTFIKSTDFSETNAFISDPPSPLKHVGEGSFGHCDTVLSPFSWVERMSF
jgi:hypothetical protein